MVIKNNTKKDKKNPKKDNKPTKCWVLDYKPSFKTLVYPKTTIIKFKNAIYDKSITMNLMFIGCKGSGKNTLLQCIFKELYKVDLSMFKQDTELNNVFYYKSIYMIDFKNLYSNQIAKNIDFIKVFSKRILLFNNTIEKIIVLKNVALLSSEMLKKLKNTIDKYSIYCKFIVLTTKPIDAFNGFFCNLKIPQMTQLQFKKAVNKILKKNNIDLKTTKLSHTKIYNTYKKTSFNFKDILLWLQYTIENNDNGGMLIKNKLVATLLNYVLSSYKLTCKDDEYHFNKIKTLLYNLVGMGVSYLDLIKISLTMILKEKSINAEFKSKVISFASNASIQLEKVDKKIFVVQDYFLNIAILFKDK